MSAETTPPAQRPQPRPSGPPPGWLTASAVLLTPVVVVLAGLVFFRLMTFWPAVLAFCAIALGLGLIARSFLTDLATLTERVSALAQDGTDAPVSVRAVETMADLSVAIERLARSWHQRNQTLGALLSANETVLDALPDPLLMLNASRKVVRANRAARRLFGGPLAGRDFATILRTPEVLERAHKVLGGQGGEVEFALPVPVERRFIARFEPLPMATQDGIVAILTLHDITAIKRSEQMRADFVANASHELRTPLATLIGFIETLRGPAKGDPEAAERFLGIMHEQGSRMARLVSDLLSLSRIELEEHSPPTARVDLRRLLQGVRDSLEITAGARGVALSLDLPADLPEVTGDSDQLTQVFQNLIDNATKYGRRDSEVRVEAGPSRPGRVAIRVIDRGEGIPREHLPRLTERFYRVDSARSRQMGGTGLGLAIVKHIINRHRGQLTIESVMGQGSTFTVVLPVAGKAPE